MKRGVLLAASLALLVGGCGVDQALYNAKMQALQKCQADMQKQEESYVALQNEYKAAKGKLGSLEGEKVSLSGRLTATKAELEILRRQREAAEKRMATFR